ARKPTRSAIQQRQDRRTGRRRGYRAGRRRLRASFRLSHAGGGSGEEARYASGSFLRSDHTAEADVAGRRVDWMRMACGRTIAPAIVWRTKMRAALENFLWNAARVGGIDARGGTHLAAA